MFSSHMADAKLHLETRICDIDDHDFQAMVDELCECVGKNRAEFINLRFSFMLMAIVKEDPKCLSKQYLAAPRILTQKVDKLSPGTVVFQICKELVDLNRLHIESFDGKMVLSLLKKCSKIYRGRPSPARRTLRN